MASDGTVVWLHPIRLSGPPAGRYYRVFTKLTSELVFTNLPRAIRIASKRVWRRPTDEYPREMRTWTVRAVVWSRATPIDAYEVWPEQSAIETLAAMT
jgi:hypothetical protein